VEELEDLGRVAQGARGGPLNFYPVAAFLRVFNKMAFTWMQAMTLAAAAVMSYMVFTSQAKVVRAKPHAFVEDARQYTPTVVSDESSGGTNINLF
jgi:hypothetical protein